MVRLAPALLLLLTPTAVAAADPIVGNWRTEAGSIAGIAPCGTSLCITLRSGQLAGKQIGTITASGNGRYSGTVIDPASDKSYSGSGTLSGNSLQMSGCVLAGLICQTQTWTRR